MKNDLQTYSRSLAEINERFDLCESIQEKWAVAKETENLKRAAEALGRVDIAQRAATMIMRFESAIAKATPAMTGADKAKAGAVGRGANKLVASEATNFKKDTASKLRKAYADPVLTERYIQDTIRRGDVPTRSGLLQEARRRQKDANAKQTKEKYEAEASLAPSTSITLHNCSCAQLKNKLAPASVDCIITDPPYTRQAVEAGCYADLMRLAGHALKTNGILAAFASVTHMTEVVSDFRQYAGAMQYITTIVLLKNRKPIQAQPPQLRYYHGWTPLFLYAKGGNKDTSWKTFINVIQSDYEKTVNDEWEQSGDLVRKVFDLFAKRGDVVCDPFLGGGTMALQARIHGCAFTGCDTNAEDVRTVKDRLNGFNK